MKLKSKLIYFIASFFLASILILPAVNVQAGKTAQQLPMELQGLSMNFQQIPLEEFFKIIANHLQIDNVEIEKGIAKVPVNILIEKLPNEQIFSTLSKQLNVRIKNENNTLKVNALTAGIKRDVRFGEMPDAETQGAMLEFNVTRLKKIGDQMNTKTGTFSIWSEFDKQAFVKLGENWQMAIKVDDLYESFFLSTEIFTSSESPEMKVLASPKLMIKPGKKATIEWKDESDEQTITIDINAVRSLRPGAQTGS